MAIVRQAICKLGPVEVWRFRSEAVARIRYEAWDFHGNRRLRKVFIKFRNWTYAASLMLPRFK